MEEVEEYKYQWPVQVFDMLVDGFLLAIQNIITGVNEAVFQAAIIFLRVLSIKLIYMMLTVKYLKPSHFKYIIINIIYLIIGILISSMFIVKHVVVASEG